MASEWLRCALSGLGVTGEVQRSPGAEEQWVHFLPESQSGLPFGLGKPKRGLGRLLRRAGSPGRCSAGTAFWGSRV